MEQVTSLQERNYSYHRLLRSCEIELCDLERNLLLFISSCIDDAEMRCGKLSGTTVVHKSSSLDASSSTQHMRP